MFNHNFKFYFDRNSLIKSLNTIQEEKSKLNLQLETQIKESNNKHEATEAELKELSHKYKELTRANIEQQSQIEKLLEDLATKDSVTEAKPSIKKCDEVKRLRQSLQLSNDKLKYLNTKNETEMQQLKKKTAKEMEVLKLTSEQTIARNGELSRSNCDLRKKNQQLEIELKEVHEKLYVSKQNTELLKRVKKEFKEELDNAKKEIASLENLRDECLKKNKAQQAAIEQMLEQIASFKSEFELLIKRNSNLEEKLKKLTNSCDLYKNKCLELKQEKRRLSLDRKEMTTNIETMEINLIKNLVRDLKLDEKTNLHKFEEKSSYTIKFQNTSIGPNGTQQVEEDFEQVEEVNESGEW